MLILLKVAAVYCGTNGDKPIDNTPRGRNSIEPVGSGDGRSARGLLGDIRKAEEAPAATAATERDIHAPAKDYV